MLIFGSNLLTETDLRSLQKTGHLVPAYIRHPEAYSTVCNPNFVTVEDFRCPVTGDLPAGFNEMLATQKERRRLREFSVTARNTRRHLRRLRYA